MSNNKVEVSRELLERLDRASRSMGWEGFSQELRALLAVPAVQPQSDPVAIGYIQGVGERFIGKAEYDPRNGYVIPIYTAPVIEQQAVAYLCEKGHVVVVGLEAFRRVAYVHGHDRAIPDVWTRLYTAPPAPVALTQDVVDRIVPSLSPEPDREEFHCEWALWADRERIRSKLAQLMTANPAPVAVVLPERRTTDVKDSDLLLMATSWNTCIDEVKRLNP